MTDKCKLDEIDHLDDAERVGFDDYTLDRSLHYTWHIACIALTRAYLLLSPEEKEVFRSARNKKFGGCETLDVPRDTPLG